MSKKKIIPQKSFFGAVSQPQLSMMKMTAVRLLTVEPTLKKLLCKSVLDSNKTGEVT